MCLRLEFLDLASHDLQYVRYVSTAERRILQLACRTLAHKASALVDATDVTNADDSADAPEPSNAADKPVPLSVEAKHLSLIRCNIDELLSDIRHVAGGADESMPPALVLSEADLHRSRCPLPELLGAANGRKLLISVTQKPPAAVGPPNAAAGAREAAAAAREAAAAAREAAAEASGNATAMELDYPHEIGVEAEPALADVSSVLAHKEVVGLYFAAAWCGGCRAAEPGLIRVYEQLKGRSVPFESSFVGLDLLWCRLRACCLASHTGCYFKLTSPHLLLAPAVIYVSHDACKDEFDAHRATMPWPALPWASSLHTELADKFHVAALPTIVLLKADGTLISTDGLRLLRGHARAFPWSVPKPLETPHHMPLLDRMLRRGPVSPGAAETLSAYLPVDFMLMPERVAGSAKDALSALRYCDKLCTLLSVQSHTVKNSSFLKFALLQHTFTQLLPLPVPKTHANFSSCIWGSQRRLYSAQLDIAILLERLVEHFAAAAFSIEHTRHTDGPRMLVPAAIAAILDAVLRVPPTDVEFPPLSLHLAEYTLGAWELLAKQRRVGTPWQALHPTQLTPLVRLSLFFSRAAPSSLGLRPSSTWRARASSIILKGRTQSRRSSPLKRVTSSGRTRSE